MTKILSPHNFFHARIFTCKHLVSFSNLFLILLALSFFEVNGQQVTIRGSVTDDKLQPLEGASIRLIGNSAGAITDRYGKFVINTSTASGVLVISFEGYVTEEISFNKQSLINIVLKTQPRSLDAVVIVGYGTVKRKDITGSVGSVDVSSLSGTPIKSIDQALQGRVSGY